MKSIVKLILILVPFLNFAQSNCRNFEIKDIHNNDNASISCDYPTNADGCIELHAEYNDFKATNDYTVEDINFQPYGSLDQGTVVQFEGDDHFGSIIDLPFNFCYFGQTYDKVVIGDNGLISFDVTLAQSDSPFFSSFIPNPALYNSTIYGLYHDVTNDTNVFGCNDNPATGLNECGDVRYRVIGQEPCRQFVVNYNQMNHFNDETSQSSFQIVLLEATQSIEVHILNKPINNETVISGQYRKNATIGIQNQDGSIAISPEGRNNEIFAASNEAWRFTPNGESIVSINWYNEENQNIGSGDTVMVCFEEATEIRAEATYDFCNGYQAVDVDYFNISYDASYPHVGNQTFQICDPANSGELEVNLLTYAQQIVNHNYTIDVFETKDNAIANENAYAQTENYTLTANQTFWVRLSQDDNCFAVGSFTLEMMTPPSLQHNSLEVCDFDNNGAEVINLTDYVPYLVGNNADMQISFHTTALNAEAQTNAVTQINLNGNSSVFVNVSLNGACNTVVELPINISNAPSLLSDIYIDVCENTQRINLLENLPADVLTNYNSVYFYRTAIQAENDENRLGNAHNFPLHNYQSIFMRVNLGAACYAIVEIHFNYLDAPEIEEDVRLQCDSDENGSEVFDLTLSIQDMITDASNLEITYFTSSQAASQNNEDEKITTPEAYEVAIGKHFVYVRFENLINGCVTVQKITVFAVPIPEAMITEFEFCNPDELIEMVVDLHTMDMDLIGSQVFIETYYYATLEDAENQTNEIFETELNPEETVYVRMIVEFEGEVLCDDIFELNLSLTTTIGDPIYFDLTICDNQNNGTEYVDLFSYQQMIWNNSNITNCQFFNEDGTVVSNPSNYIMENSTTIEVRQRDNRYCKNSVFLNFTFETGVTAADILKYFCDEAPYGTETLDIESLIYEANPGLNVNSIEVYKNRNAALNQDQNHRINNIQNYELTQSVIILYGRLADGENCPSIIQIALKLKETPHASNPTIAICDNDDDGTETFQLSTYNPYIFGTSSYNVAYYQTAEDAENSTNAITHITVTEGATTVYYSATNTGVVSCSNMGTIEFVLSGSASVQNVSIAICDNNNDNQERYNLKQHEGEIVGMTSDYEITYYRNEQNAISGTNPINSPGNALISGDNPIIWVRVENEAGCYSLAQITINFNQAPELTNIEVGSCDDDFNMVETLDLTSYAAEMTPNFNNYSFTYYKTQNAAVTQNAGNQIENASNYTVYNQQEVVYVRAENPTSGCYSVGRMNIEIYMLPKLIDAQLEVCDTDFDGNYEVDILGLDTVIIEDVNNYQFFYFETLQDAENDTNALSTQELYILPNIGTGLYVKVINENGCSAISYINFIEGEASKGYIEPEAALVYCDDDTDGSIYFDLTEIEESISMSGEYSIVYFESLLNAQLQNNAIVDPQNYFNLTPNQTIYVRATEEGKCSIILDFPIQVNPLPTNPLEELYEKCPGYYVSLDGGEAESYLWSTGETTKVINVKQAGIYELTTTNEFGCSQTFTTEVKDYSLATVNYNFTDQNTVVFDVIGESTYSFSLDGEQWQDSNVFFDLEQGTYTVHVKDNKTGCIVTLPFLVFDWYNIITPNGDGKNDSWVECGLEVFGTDMSHLVVYDRYGKEIYTESSNDCFNWDAKYQGRALPTDTYWFKVTLPDGRAFNGYIAIKNYSNGYTF